MPIHIRAYVFVMILGLLGHWYSRKALVPGSLTGEDFDRRRIYWFSITTIAFLSGDFWVFCIACAIAAGWMARKETNVLALFVAILFAVPPVTRYIPGIPPMDVIIPISHQRILSTCILLPCALRLFSERHKRERGAVAPDIFVGLYLLYFFVRNFMADPFHYAIRWNFLLTIDIWALYYVASRSVFTLSRFREAVAALVGSLSVVALIAAFESLRRWRIYGALNQPFDAGPSAYVSRGDLGLLRVEVTLGHPIILGMAMGIGLLLMLSMGSQLVNKRWRLPLTAMFALACLLALSRGPWVATVAGCIVLILSGPGRARRIAYSVFAVVLCGLALSATPFGRSIFKMMPKFGDSENDGSVAYRQQLWDVSVEVWKQNFWFGDLHYIRNPMMEVMRQGEGIIDMVNTYAHIGLALGLLGLCLFAACALSCWAVASRAIPADHPDREALESFRKAMRACVFMVLVTYATVSEVGYASAFLWVFLGLSAGLPRLVSVSKPTEPVSRQAPSPGARLGSALPPSRISSSSPSRRLN